MKIVIFVLSVLLLYGRCGFKDQNLTEDDIPTIEELYFDFLNLTARTDIELERLRVKDTELEDDISRIHARVDVLNLTQPLITANVTALGRRVDDVDSTTNSLWAQTMALNVSIQNLHEEQVNRTTRFVDLDNIEQTVEGQNIRLRQLETNITNLGTNTRIVNRTLYSSLLVEHGRIDTLDTYINALILNSSSMSVSVNSFSNDVSSVGVSLSGLESQVNALSRNVSELSQRQITFYLNETVDVSHIMSNINNATTRIREAESSVVQLESINEALSRNNTILSRLVNESETLYLSLKTNHSRIVNSLRGMNLTRLRDISFMNESDFRGTTYNTYVKYPGRMATDAELHSHPLLVQIQQTVNAMWLIVSGVMALLLPVGIGLLISGLSRSKNSVLAMTRVVWLLSIGAIAFWIVGYPLSAEGDNPVVGTDNFWMANYTNVLSWTFFFASASFGAIAATGSFAERASITVDAVSVVIFVVILFPLSAYSAWDRKGYLRNRGFIDFSGASCIHIPAGVMALVGSWYVGPRLGRFRRGTEAIQMNPNSPLLASLGLVFIWFATFSLAPAAAARIEASAGSYRREAMARAALSTAVAGGVGVVISFTQFFFPSFFRKKRDVIIMEEEEDSAEVSTEKADDLQDSHFWDIGSASAAVRVALVSVSGCVGITDPRLCAAVAVVAVLSERIVAGVMLKVVYLDDAIRTGSIHLIGGVLSLVANGLFADCTYVKECFPDGKGCGVFSGGGFSLMREEAIGIGCVFALSAITSFIIYPLLRKILGTLRVSLDVEHSGPGNVSTPKRTRELEVVGKNTGKSIVRLLTSRNLRVASEQYR